MVRIRTHANPFQVPDPTPLEPRAGSGGAPFLLEIGFGRGDFLIGLAQAHPEAEIVGLEIRRALVDHVAERAALLGLQNVRPLLADATRHLHLLVAPASIQATFIFFPDPWRKARHLKRRVLRATLLDALAAFTRPGGTIDFQTDSQSIAASAATAVAAHPEWNNRAGRDVLIDPRIPDCGSRRQRMHSARGATIYKMRFVLGVAPADDAKEWLGSTPNVPAPFAQE